MALNYGVHIGLRLLESVQRSFTRHIQARYDSYSEYSHSYTDRLSLLKLYSLCRRRDRYSVTYIWKILDNIVLNLNNPICCYNSNRRGRLCVSSHVGIGHLGTLVYQSFRCIRLLNAMSKQIMNISGGSM